MSDISGARTPPVGQSIESKAFLGLNGSNESKETGIFPSKQATAEGSRAPVEERASRASPFVAMVPAVLTSSGYPEHATLGRFPRGQLPPPARAQSSVAAQVDAKAKGMSHLETPPNARASAALKALNKML